MTSTVTDASCWPVRQARARDGSRREFASVLLSSRSSCGCGRRSPRWLSQFWESQIKLPNGLRSPELGCARGFNPTSNPVTQQVPIRPTKAPASGSRGFPAGAPSTSVRTLARRSSAASIKRLGRHNDGHVGLHYRPLPALVCRALRDRSTTTLARPVPTSDEHYADDPGLRQAPAWCKMKVVMVLYEPVCCAIATIRYVSTLQRRSAPAAKPDTLALQPAFMLAGCQPTRKTGGGAGSLIGSPVWFPGKGRIEILFRPVARRARSRYRCKVYRGHSFPRSERRYEVRCVARSERLAGRFAGVDVVRGDVFDAPSILAAMDGSRSLITHSSMTAIGRFLAERCEAAATFGAAAQKLV